MQSLLVVLLSMEQLDLFGFPVESPKPPKKKEPAAKTTPVVPAQIYANPEPVQTIEVVPEAVPAEAEIALTVEEVFVETVTLPEVAEIEVALIEPVVIAAATIPVSKPRTLTAAKTASKRGRKSFREMDSEADLVDVPEENILQQKLYYSISEVAGWFKVNTSLLRFWENEFDILQPRKTRKGDRLFRVEDIKNLQLIYFLLRQRKFSIDGAKKFLKENKKEADTQAQLVQSLTKFRSFLLELKTNMAS